jgi:hypothetical protein
MIEQKEAEKLRKFEVGGEGKEKNRSFAQRPQRTQKRIEKADSSDPKA